MRDYELVLVFDPDLTSEKRKKLSAKIKKQITDLKGKVKQADDWGKKDLAYPIKKKTAGYYFLWELSLPAEGPLKLEKELLLEEGLLRCLLVKVNKPAPAKKKKTKGGEKK